LSAAIAHPLLAAAVDVCHPARLMVSHVRNHNRNGTAIILDFSEAGLTARAALHLPNGFGRYQHYRQPIRRLVKV
jgi:hypothetical protein